MIFAISTYASSHDMRVRENTGRLEYGETSQINRSTSLTRRFSPRRYEVMCIHEISFNSPGHAGNEKELQISNIYTNSGDGWFTEWAAAQQQRRMVDVMLWIAPNGHSCELHWHNNSTHKIGLEESSRNIYIYNFLHCKENEHGMEKLRAIKSAKND